MTIRKGKNSLIKLLTSLSAILLLLISQTPSVYAQSIYQTLQTPFYDPEASECVVSEPGPGQPTLDLKAIADKYGLQSVSVKQMGGSVVGEINANVPPASPASVLKLVIADVFLNTNPSLGEEVSVKNPYGGGESYDSPISLRGALIGMLKDSVNTYANVLIDASGGLASASNSANSLGYKNTKINSYYSSEGAGPGGPNISLASDLTKAMENIFTAQGGNYRVAQDALRQSGVNFGLDSVSGYVGNKWGGNSSVTGNSAVFDVKGTKYVITLFINDAYTSETSATSKKVGDATTEIVKGLSSIGSTAPSSSLCCSTDISLIDSENGIKIWSYFRDKGLDPTQTAAILGNFNQESGGFNPKRLQGGGESETVPLDGATGYGIAQWTNIDRQKNLDRFAKDDKQKRPVYDIYLQLDFAYHEMTDSSPNDVWDNLIKINDIEAATRYFHTNFEASADDETGIRERIDDAIKFRSKYSSSDSSSGSSTACPGQGSITPPPPGSGQELALGLLQKHYKGTINGHQYSGDGQLTCQSINCRDLDNTAHAVSIAGNGGPCSVSALGKDLMQLLAVIVEQGGLAIGISSLCNDHGVGSSTGASVSRHNVGEAVDINFVNKVWLCDLSSEPHVFKLMKFVNATIGTALAPSQLLAQGVGAGSGCPRASNYIEALDRLSMNGHKSAPYYTSKYVGDHENHVHIGY